MLISCTENPATKSPSANFRTSAPDSSIIGPNPRHNKNIAGNKYLGPTQYPPSHCVYFEKNNK